MGSFSIIISIISILFVISSPILFIFSKITGIICIIIGLILGLIGLICSIISKKKKEGQAIAGIIVSGISIAFSLIIIIAFLIAKPLLNFSDFLGREQFALLVSEYASSVENKLESEGLKCSEKATELQSADFKRLEELDDGDYYIFLTTDKSAILSNFDNFPPKIAEQTERQTFRIYLDTFSSNDEPPKAQMNSLDVYGWVHIKKDGGEEKLFLVLIDTEGNGISTEVENLKGFENTIENTDLFADNFIVGNARIDMIGILERINEKENTYYCHYKQK